MLRVVGEYAVKRCEANHNGVIVYTTIYLGDYLTSEKILVFINYNHINVCIQTIKLKNYVIFSSQNSMADSEAVSS